MSPRSCSSGDSRGLGLALAADFVAGGWRVVGTVRAKPRTGPHDLADGHAGRVEVETLAIDAPERIVALRGCRSGREPGRRIPAAKIFADGRHGVELR